MKSNEELYKFIDELTAELDRIGEDDTAERIRRAMYISSVLTEVFMTLRQELIQLSRSQVQLKSDTRGQLDEAIGDIGRALSV